MPKPVPEPQLQPEWQMVKPDGMIIDEPFHREMLNDEDANRASAYLSMQWAMANLGLTPEEAEKYFGYKGKTA